MQQNKSLRQFINSVLIQDKLEQKSVNQFQQETQQHTFSTDSMAKKQTQQESKQDRNKHWNKKMR